MPPFVRYILINKPLLHTTRIISPIILSPFTMSKVTKASIKCAAAAQKYREGLEPSAKARYLEKLALIGGEDPYGTWNTFNRWETSSSHHIPWYREWPALYTQVHTLLMTWRATKDYRPITRCAVDGYGIARPENSVTSVWWNARCVPSYGWCYVCKLCRSTHLVSFTKCTYWCIAVKYALLVVHYDYYLKLFPHILFMVLIRFYSAKYIMR